MSSPPEIGPNVSCINGFNHCDGLMEVPLPFDHFEILDLDNGLGFHLPAFEVTPNFGMGDNTDPPEPVLPIFNDIV